MPKLNFKGFVTTCAVSLFTVSSANAQQLSSVSAGSIWGTAPMSLPSRDVVAETRALYGTRDLDAEIERLAKLKLPNFAKEDVFRFMAKDAIKSRDERRYEEELTILKRPTYGFALNETPRFNRNMVKTDLDNACKSNGSAQNCTETFEAAANVVAVLDPNKGGAAEWTGRKAEEVSNDLVKLGGTQEQLMNVVQISTDKVKFLEQSLPANTRIDGPKEATAVNLVKAVIKVSKLDTTSNSDEDAFLETAKNLLSTLKTVESMGVVSVNNNIIAPVGQAIRSLVPAKAITTDDGVSGLDFSDNEAGGIPVVLENNIFPQKVEAMTSLREKTGMINSHVRESLIIYQLEKAQQAKQNDAPTATKSVAPVGPPSPPPSVTVPQPQQQNCNPQWQDC